jgi:hypothetical protein
MPAEKRMLLHLVIFYFLHLLYIILGSGPFKGVFFEANLFYNYLLGITLIFALVFGYLGLIIESFRVSKERWKPVLVVLVFSSVIMTPAILTHGFEALSKFSWYDIKTAFVEEVAWRSLFLGLLLKIYNLELEKPRIRQYSLPFFWFTESTWKMGLSAVLLASLAFSLFHFWDLVLSFNESSITLDKLGKRTAMGFVYGMLYLFSGQRIYPSIILHYVNNVYAP